MEVGSNPSEKQPEQRGGAPPTRDTLASCKAPPLGRAPECVCVRGMWSISVPANAVTSSEGAWRSTLRVACASEVYVFRNILRKPCGMAWRSSGGSCGLRALLS